MTLFEADAKIDTGRIWFKTSFDLAGTELLDEINDRLFETEIALMTKVDEFSSVEPRFSRARVARILDVAHPRIAGSIRTSPCPTSSIFCEPSIMRGFPHFSTFADVGTS